MGRLFLLFGTLIVLTVAVGAGFQIASQIGALGGALAALVAFFFGEFAVWIPLVREEGGV